MAEFAAATLACSSSYTPLFGARPKMTAQARSLRNNLVFDDFAILGHPEA
jgi:hypothetical protein